METKPHTRLPLRRFAASVGALGLVFVGLTVTAEPAHADTDLVVKDDYSGTRTMMLELSEYAGSNLMVGLSELDAAISESCPEELTYGGMETNDDEETIFTFTLSFSSIDDYNEKVSSLTTGYLEEGETAKVTLTEYEYTLKTGFSYQESFSSDDLFLWLKDELEGDEIALGSFDSIFDLGTITVDYQGEEYRSWWGSEVSIEEMENDGFSDISMETTLDNEGHWTRVITFKAYTYDDSFGIYQSFFNENSPDWAELEYEEGSWLSSWIVTLGPTSADEIQSGTASLFQDENAVFTVEEGVAATDALAEQIHVTSTVSCLAVCENRSDRVSETIVVPEEYISENESSGYWWGFDDDESDTHIYSKYIPVESIEATTSYSSSGAPTVKISYEVTSDVGNSYREVLENGLIPEIEGLSGEISEGDTWTVDVEITGGGVEDVTTTLNAYLPGSSITSEKENASFFKNEQSITQIWDFSGLLVSSQLNGDVTYKWEGATGLQAETLASYYGVGSGNAIPNGEYTTSTLGGAVFTYTQSSMPVTGIVTVIIIAVVVIAGIVLLVVFRRKLFKHGPQVALADGTAYAGGAAGAGSGYSGGWAAAGMTGGAASGAVRASGYASTYPGASATGTPGGATTAGAAPSYPGEQGAFPASAGASVLGGLASASGYHWVSPDFGSNSVDMM